MLFALLCILLNHPFFWYFAKSVYVDRKGKWKQREGVVTATSCTETDYMARFPGRRIGEGSPIENLS